jgi:hypothetical protein
MKRLNPNTGLPFKRGDLDKDGMLFHRYSSGKNTKTGLFYEVWLSPNDFKSLREQANTNRAINRTKPKARAEQLFHRAQTRSKEKNLPILITKLWIENKLSIGVCELTGIPFDFYKKEKVSKNPYAPSLDRINSSKGYTKTNTRVVLSAVNDALNQYEDKTMLPILKAMVKGIEKNAEKKTASRLPKKSNRAI